MAFSQEASTSSQSSQLLATIRFHNVLRPILDFIGIGIGMLLLIVFFLSFIMFSYDYFLVILEGGGVDIPEKFFIFNKEQFYKALRDSFPCPVWKCPNE